MKIEKPEFINLVYSVLYEHPEWFKDVIMATQQATLDKLVDHSTKRARAEGALSLAYPYFKPNAERKAGGCYEQAVGLAREVLLVALDGTEFGRKLKLEIEGKA